MGIECASFENQGKLWSRILKTDTCWLWQGGKSHGYGITNFESRKESVHRTIYRICVGEIPEGLQLDHLCRVKLCCNPAHLEPVTARENIRRGMCPAAKTVRYGYCIRGHKFEEGSYIQCPSGRRCKKCASIRYASYMAANKDHLARRRRIRYLKERAEKAANA